MTLSFRPTVGNARPRAARGAGRARLRILLLLLALAGVSGCGRQVMREQVPPTDSTVWLGEGAAIGQTFVAHHDGLNGLAIYLTADGTSGGEIALRLAESSGAIADLAVARVPVEASDHGRWFSLELPAQRESRQRYYYAALTYSGPGRVGVATAPGDAYLHGALVVDGVPRDAQVAFRLAFDRGAMLLGLAREAATSWLPISLASALALLLPGLALLAFLWPGRDGHCWPARVGLAAGLGAGLHPLLFLLAHLVRVRFGPAYPWAVALASAAALALRWWWTGRRLTRPNLAAILRHEAFWQDVTLIGVLGLIVVTRFLAIGSLEAPMWGDSLQHTMIAQLLVDNGGLFDEWWPYAELRSFSYHYGFHALAAVLHWLTGLGVADAVLWMGQVLNVLATLSLYPLAERVGGSRWAGVGAVLIAGLLSPMPMQYLNWGRYTQLAGQVILPALACFALRALEARRLERRALVLAALALVGLALTHYRVLLISAPLFAMLLLWPRGVRRGRLVGRMALLGGGAVLLAAPWYLNVLTGTLSALVWGQVVASSGAGPVAAGDLGALGPLAAYLPIGVWLTLPLSIGWGLWRREREAALVALWWLGAFLLVNPQLLRLPGAGTITNFALFIALYVPAAVLIGAGLGWLAEARGSRAASAVAAVALLTLGMWGARERLVEANPAAHALVTRPDLRAAEWIAANTPPDARFLVNSFFAYEGSSVVGSDAGWWLPLTARRATTLPPLTYVAEEGPRPDYRLWVNGLTEALRGGRLDGKALAALREHGVTHVYIGQRQGRVNYAGPDVLDPAMLAASPSFRVLYHQDRVWVFEFLDR